jgi:hypothetical protein
MNRLRILLLSTLVLITVAGMLPLTESLAKWSRRSSVAQHRRFRRHSRAWWRRHRARLRARRARSAELRRAREAANGADAANARRTNSRLSKTALLAFDDASVVSPLAPRAPAAAASDSTPAPAAPFVMPAAPGVAPAAVVARAVQPARSSQLPFDFAPPHTWTPARKTKTGAAVFSVTTPDGRSAGTAVVAPVALSPAEMAAAPATAKTKTVGGLSLTALRRKVIDRMVAEGGWVTNDFVQEIHGRRVFVVLAQTGTPGAPTQSWAFYFTEVDGRVYSLATNAPVEYAVPVGAGVEQFLASLRSAADKSMASQR